MKRGEKLRAEMEEFLNMVRFLKFVNIDIDCIALPAFKELDFFFGDTI